MLYPYFWLYPLLLWQNIHILRTYGPTIRLDHSADQSGVYGLTIPLPLYQLQHSVCYLEKKKERKLSSRQKQDNTDYCWLFACHRPVCWGVGTNTPSRSQVPAGRKQPWGRAEKVEGRRKMVKKKTFSCMSVTHLYSFWSNGSSSLQKVWTFYVYFTVKSSHIQRLRNVQW